jgi:hypothetical protein
VVFFWNGNHAGVTIFVTLMGAGQLLVKRKERRKDGWILCLIRRRRHRRKTHIAGRHAHQQTNRTCVSGGREEENKAFVVYK